MKIIFKILIFFLLSIILFISYGTFIGFETKRFNDQIIKKIKNINPNLNLELKEIKIILNPLERKLNAKTIGSKLSSGNKSIEIESIKTQIPFSSIFNEKILINNLEVSSKSLKINDLISFIRIFNKDPELYILNKVIKKGFLIADVKIDFDEKGRIKNNFVINGLIRDTEIDIFKKYNLKNINFAFRYDHNFLKILDTNLLFNDLKIYSKSLKVKKVKDEFIVNGKIQTKDLNFNDKNIKLFIQPYLPLLEIKQVKLSSNNEFNFKINKKFQISDFSTNSKIQLTELSFLNNNKFDNFFPKVNKILKLSNHKLDINYKKDNLIINGLGDILLQKNIDQLTYIIKKSGKKYNFKNSLIINENSLVLDFLNFEKDQNSQMKISFNGSGELGKKTKINLISAIEGENQFEIKNLELNKKFKILNFSNIRINYLDRKKLINKFNITSKNGNYSLKGSSFNADHFIEKWISSDDELNLFKKKFDLKIKIDELFLDKSNLLDNFEGNLIFFDNEITEGNLSGFFSKNEKLNLTIKSTHNEKITTLFLDRAEPIVKRYKFIKGFTGGKLDFYSSKKDNESISKIKIYNFKLNELPALTKLLTLASLQGIADLLSGEGISFDEFEMNFRNKENVMTIDEIYAIGPAISILMNGYVEKNKLISLRGTLVPATTINKAIGSIPILGQILVGKKTGEGVFGVSFKIKGSPKNLETTVNPIKTLTPRFITRTLEKIKKTN